MGRSIPVKLSNGRFWPNKKDAKAYFRELLSRYDVYDRVNNIDDISDLTSILTVYDENLPVTQSKIGVGIAYFEKRPDQEHSGSSACFYVIRIDGTSVDFSIYKALDAAAK